MRKGITISLPKEMAEEVEETVKEEKFASKSEFFRYLIREWEKQQTVKDIRESQEELKKGKGKLLKSLEDLR